MVLKENDLLSQQIRRVAVVGTGLIGASWAAHYLASGLDVMATDPAPNAEANLRKCVDAAWDLLTPVGPCSECKPRPTDLHRRYEGSGVERRLCAGERSRTACVENQGVTQMDEVAPPDTILASSASGISMDAVQSAASNIPSAACWAIPSIHLT